MGRMDQQGYGEVLDASTGAGSAQCSAGVWVYDADGEKLGTVSDWQDMHNFLIIHKGRLLGHDTCIPHAAIHYSDMNGVHLRLRQADLQGDLTSIQQPLLEQTAPIPTISMALPILVPDMRVAAVAARAFADNVTFTPARPRSSSVQFAVEVAHDITVQAGKEASQGVGQDFGQTMGLMREQVKARRWRWRSKR
jgi:hypothetical protein